MPRKSKIVELAKGAKKVVDFGCDHGLILKDCFEINNIEYGYAIDNKEGPLNNAKKNLEGYPVSFYLLDSFKDFKEDFDTCIITGLGASVIIDILKTAPKNKKYILGSHSKVHILRDYLSNNNFEIIDEALAFENNVYYELIVCKTGKQKLTEKEKYRGLYIDKDILFNNYRMHKIKFLEDIKKNQPNNLKEETSKIMSFFK